MPVYSRISARRGSIVNLDVDFYNGGQLADPILYRVEIFKAKVTTDNIVAAFQLDPDATDFPSPVEQLMDGSQLVPGKYKLQWLVPNDLVVPDAYFDVWYFFNSDPRTGSGDTFADHESELIQVCNRFWVYPENWFASTGLQTIRFAFEPLDIKFNKPEVRPLELGLMPLPLYDYNFNLVAPMIPYITPRITIKTENKEVIIDNVECSIKLRQGNYRSNPFVISYNLDTDDFFIGTYEYRVTVTLPDGSVRTSPSYYLTVS